MRKRTLQFTVIAAILLLFFVYALDNMLNRKANAHGLLTSQVIRADLEDAILVSGVVNATNYVNVGAQVSGQIKAIHVQAGDRVKRGQLLAVIDPALQINELERAEAGLADAIAQEKLNQQSLQFLRKTLVRQQELHEAHVNTKAELDLAQNEVAKAEIQLTISKAQVARARTAVASAHATLAYTSIKAPADGDILQVFVQVGQTIVSAQTSSPILAMGSLDIMEVKARISEVDVARIMVGQQAYFTKQGIAENTFSGKLKTLDIMPESAQQSGGGIRSGINNQSTGAIYYNALFNIPNPARVIKPEMTGQVRILRGVRQQALLVPITALISTSANGKNASVCVLNGDGHLNLKTVKIGLSSGLNVEVTQGLAEGDQVILQSEGSNLGSEIKCLPA